MTTSKIILGMSVYNEEENIVPCLESHKELIDAVHLVDGRFFGYPGSPYSTDKTIELAKEWCRQNDKDLKVSYFADFRQKDKSSVYLSSLPEGYGTEKVFILTAAADHRLFGDMEKIRAEFNEGDEKGENFFSFYCDESQIYGRNYIYLKNALIRYYGGLRWFPDHWTIYRGDQKFCDTHTSPSTTLPAIIKNLPYDKRPFTRLLERANYRGMRVFTQSFENTAENPFEQGSSNIGKFLETEQDLDRTIDLAYERFDKSENPDDEKFWTGFWAWLLYIKKGAKDAPPMIRNREIEGIVLAMLYALKVIPNPLE